MEVLGALGAAAFFRFGDDGPEAALAVAESLDPTAVVALDPVILVAPLDTDCPDAVFVILAGLLPLFSSVTVWLEDSCWVSGACAAVFFLGLPFFGRPLGGTWLSLASLRIL